MFKNYFKIALRNLQRQKVYSLINITGLALGMMCTILISLWIMDELSYDRFHNNMNAIYRVNSVLHRSNIVVEQHQTPSPLAEQLINTFPEIKNVTRFRKSELLFQYQSKAFQEKNAVFAESSFFEMFTFPLLKGDPKTALLDPNSMVISESMCEKYFGREEPIGKTFIIDDKHEFIITGVVKNPPDNSTIKFDFLLSYNSIHHFFANLSLDNFIINTYVLLGDNIQKQELEQKINKFIAEYDPNIEMKLDPLSRHHLYSIERDGDVRYVYIFSVIAFFILIIACINFINLSTAQSFTRAKEVGMRKVIGANRNHLVQQFFGESIVLSFIALLVSLVLTEIFLPVFNHLSGKGIVVLGSKNILVYVLISVVAVATGIISGMYPALFLSSFAPTKVLKGVLKSTSSGRWLRNALVVLQFSISIILVIGTIVISNQLYYMQDKKLGFEKENLIYFQIREDVQDNYQSMKNELLQHSNISAVTMTSDLPSRIGNITSGYDWENKDFDGNLRSPFLIADVDFIKTLKMEMHEGRSFSPDLSSDISNFILNEEAVKQMGIENPVGKWFSMWGNTGKIIGVVKDFHFQPVNDKIEPLVITPNPIFFSYILVRIQSDNVQPTMQYMQQIWKKYYPDRHFEAHFLDEKYDNLYQTEERLRKIFRYCSVFAIFISCLGLFGLSTFTIKQCKKEIGIRKVVGASVPSIVYMLSANFTKWVLLANIIAWPIAYFAMNKWLQSFAYRIDLSWWIFVLAGTLALVIALLTVSYQAMRAATANPVESLRYE